MALQYGSASHSSWHALRLIGPWLIHDCAIPPRGHPLNRNVYWLGGHVPAGGGGGGVPSVAHIVFAPDNTDPSECHTIELPAATVEPLSPRPVPEKIWLLLMVSVSKYLQSINRGAHT